ncbi:MAG: cache domain-containing protein, partial [Calditrichia bacterium]|nr:cache domain-containing protein [Calditrichia bacterium]
MSNILKKIKKFNFLKKDAFKAFFGKKISRRLILTNLSLSIFPLILVSFIFLFINNKTITSYIFQRNFETAKRAANEINLFLETPRRVLISLANSPSVSSMDRFVQNLIITKIKADYPLFNSIYIIRNNGKLAVTTSYERENIDFTHQPVFKTALQGKEYFSSITFTENQSPVMYISEPIFKYGKVIAVIIGEIEIKNIWDLLDDITIGETGNTFLFSADGTIIAHSDKTKVLEQQKVNQYAFYREIVSGKSGINRYEDENNTSYLAAYIPVPDLFWGLVLQQEEDEAFALAHKLLLQILTVVVVTFIFSIITS